MLSHVSILVILLFWCVLVFESLGLFPVGFHKMSLKAAQTAGTGVNNNVMGEGTVRYVPGVAAAHYSNLPLAVQRMAMGEGKGGVRPGSSDGFWKGCVTKLSKYPRAVMLARRCYGFWKGFVCPS